MRLFEGTQVFERHSQLIANAMHFYSASANNPADGFGTYKPAFGYLRYGQKRLLWFHDPHSSLDTCELSELEITPNLGSFWIQARRSSA
jgi:hypothetical protein